jgi:hypothetical protein
MSATDKATEAALTRAGIAPKEAQRLLLQSPLDPKVSSALESPVAKYLVPFRRTPINQLFQGLETLKGKHPRVLGGSIAAGVATGATVEDPYKIGLTAPLAATYALPFVGGAAIGRKVFRGKSSGAFTGVSPISEYGLESAILDPLRPIREPAILAALRRLRGERQ